MLFTLFFSVFCCFFPGVMFLSLQLGKHHLLNGVQRKTTIEVLRGATYECCFFVCFLIWLWVISPMLYGFFCLQLHKRQRPRFGVFAFFGVFALLFLGFLSIYAGACFDRER